MVRHNDVRVQEEFSLSAIVEDGFFKQFRSGRNLKKAAAFGRHGGDKIRPSLLWREPHLSSINERPVAKATFLQARIQGAEAPCSLRKNKNGLNSGDPTAPAPSVLPKLPLRK